ncbi:MAG: sulfur carrier protein [Nitrospirota bacterium]|nr:sulfur carrier protein [Nitrospirota bacterium]
MVNEIQIQVNGELRGWRDGGTVADLLKDLTITTERVAVELNLEILDRKDFGQRSLREGDRIEILGFIGGGCGTKGERDGRER